MDFVVVGLGVGALAILLGLTVRETAARWWPVRPERPLSPDQTARRLAIGRAGRAGGRVLSLAGAAIVVVTLIALGLGVSDRVGAILVMAVISAAVLGGIVWGTLFTHRYHPRPLPRTPGRRPGASVRDESPSLAGTIDAAVARRGSRFASSGLEAPDERDDEPEPIPSPADDAAPIPPLVADDEAAADTETDTETAVAPPDDEAPPTDSPVETAVDPIADDDSRPAPVANAAAPKDERA